MFNYNFRRLNVLEKKSPGDLNVLVPKSLRTENARRLKASTKKSATKRLSVTVTAVMWLVNELYFIKKMRFVFAVIVDHCLFTVTVMLGIGAFLYSLLKRKSLTFCFDLLVRYSLI